MNELSYYPGLIQRGSVFHYRKRVPTDIVGTFGRREIWTSLGTGNRPEAIKRARRVAVQLDDKFDAHRNGQAEPFKVEELSQEAINRLAELRFQQAVTEHDKSRLKAVQEVAVVADMLVRNECKTSCLPEKQIPTGDALEDYNSNRAYQQKLSETEEVDRQRNYTYRREIVENWKASIKSTLQYAKDTYALLDFQLYEPNVDLLLKQENICLAKTAESYQSLVVAVLAAEIRAIEACIKKHEGSDDVELRGKMDIVHDIQTAIGANDGPLLSEEADKWASDNLTGGIWKPKTKNTILAAIDRFIEFSGDRGISTYTKADAREFREVLLKLPPNARQGRFRGLNIVQAVLLAEKEQIAPMSRKNARKILGFIGSFFKYAAAAYDEVERSPFEGIFIRKEKNPEKMRTKFTNEELVNVFSAPVFAGCKSQFCWWEFGDHDVHDTSRFWIPLVALFTGARLAEIVQLDVSDIRAYAGVRFFDINDKDEKTLKTKSSKRQIPVHAELVRIGFLDYVQRRKEVGDKRLFPEIRKSKADGTYSFTFSKWFNNFLTRTRVKTKRNCFHSFRHGFEDACRNADISGDKTDVLQGHKLPGMRGEYGDGFKLPDLAKSVEKISYPNLDLSHLYVDEP